MVTRLRRRLPGLKVRPGVVRQARQEAGLSLAGVARTDVSRTAIFLIETGKSNPTLPTLELIAERTGKPIEFFLDDEPPVVFAAIDFTEIDHSLALEAYDKVIARAGELLQVRLARADVARLRFLKGQAHIRQLEAEEAEPLLRGAREYYEATGDRTMAVECLSWEIQIPFLLEDPKALELAEAALDRCRQLKPVPVHIEARIVARIAAIHLNNQDWDRAIPLYEETIALLGPLRDVGRLARVYSDLALAYRSSGRLELAARYSEKSIALHEMLRDQRSLAFAENNLALALMNMRNFVSAEDHLQRAINLFESAGTDRGKSHVLLSLAELDLSQGNLEAAEQHGAEALELARRMNERATEAEAWKWLGMIAAAAGLDGESDRRFEAAISMLEEMNLSERLVRTHAAYAEILEDRGDMQAANTHLRQVLAMNRPDLVSTRRERVEQSRLA